MILARLLSAQPTTDGEKWKLKFAAHRDEWYTDAYGQDPAPFHRDPSSLNVANRLPYPWQPTGDTYPSSDAIWPLGGTFGLAVDTSVYPAKISASGITPVNLPGSDVFAPNVPSDGTVVTSGGFLPAGTYYVAVSWDAYKGPASAFTRIVVPSGTTNKIVVSGIKWPNSAAPLRLAFVGTSSLNMRVSPTAVGSVNDANGNPTVITIDRLSTTGVGLPDAAFQRYAMELTPIAHAGAWGAAITSVASNVITITGAGWTVNEWAGYKLALYYRAGATQVPLNLSVVSNTATTLTMSATGFLAGDVVVMRAKATTVTASTIGCAKFINSFALTGLSTGGSEIGKLIRIIGGTGAGQPAKTVASNTSTAYTINGTWDITPDSTSVWIVTEPSSTKKETGVITNDGISLSFGVVADMPAPSTAAQSLLIEAATADIHGNHFPMRYQPFREVYIPAQDSTAGGAGVIRGNTSVVY